MLETPIERITEEGLTTTDREFEFDIIVYATNFDAVTGAFDRIDIRGTNGQRLVNRCSEGPTTFVGMMVEHFPNMFMILGPHNALGNNPRSMEYNVEWIRDVIKHMGDHDLTFADATPRTMAEWTDFVRQKSQGLLANDIDSWMTGANMNVEGKRVCRLVRYSNTTPEYRDWCDRVAEAGYDEIRFE